jgi:ABC-type Fe3+/spermidine/putrescine transport system ATPase subunit
MQEMKREGFEVLSCLNQPVQNGVRIGFKHPGHGTNTDYDRPRSAFVTDFVGAANLIRGKLRRDLAPPGLIALETATGSLIYGCDNGRSVGTAGAFSVRMVYPWLRLERPAETRNVWKVRIDRRVFHGDFVQYIVAWGDGQLVIRRPPTERFDEGATVYLGIAPEHCVLLES